MKALNYWYYNDFIIEITAFFIAINIAKKFAKADVVSGNPDWGKLSIYIRFRWSLCFLFDSTFGKTTFKLQDLDIHKAAELCNTRAYKLQIILDCINPPIEQYFYLFYF